MSIGLMSYHEAHDGTMVFSWGYVMMDIGVIHFDAPYMSIRVCHKSKISLKFLEPTYLVGYAYILTENFGFGEFFSFLDW